VKSIKLNYEFTLRLLNSKVRFVSINVRVRLPINPSITTTSLRNRH
jgi:hypothetical protein